MASNEDFYSGADFGLDPNYGLEGTGGYGNFMGYRVPASEIGFPTDLRTANQLAAVSQKLNPGSKTIEVSGVNIMGGGPMKLIDTIPKQQFKEINRLKKLAGAELTFHGPLVEPTGVTRQGWDETQRQMAEKEIFSAVERGHQLDPDGNIIITLHSSSGLPEPETKVIDEKTGKAVTTQMMFVDEREGRFVPVGPPTTEYLSKDPKKDIYADIKKREQDAWFRELQHVNFNAHAGARDLQQILIPGGKIPEEYKGEYKKLIEKKPLENLYKLFVEGKTKEINSIAGPDLAPAIQAEMSQIAHADIYFRDAYQSLNNLFNQAYDAAERTDNKKDKAVLDEFREKVAPVIEDLKKDPSKIQKFGNVILDGVNTLRQISPPQVHTPLRDFAIDKASDTFSNVALKSYKKFKDTSPIISVENPPMGMGLATGQDLRDLVERSRKEFVKKAMKRKAEGGLGMSEGQAEKQAEKLLGVTWDVGHINMIRKYGYGDKGVIEETKKVAPYVKHVHLSDNFGLEHTELPMGMGNVPTKPMLEAIQKYNKKVKKIVETGDWFSQQGLAQTKTPFVENLSAMGSPVYAMKMAPYWNQVSASMGAFYSGLGATNPEIHHSIYGAGYSNLPVELGGQMAGRARMGGAPME